MEGVDGLGESAEEGNGAHQDGLHHPHMAARIATARHDLLSCAPYAGRKTNWSEENLDNAEDEEAREHGGLGEAVSRASADCRS